MTILSLRTDKPEAEIGLFKNEKQLAYITWQAHRQLSDTLLTKVEQLLQQANLKMNQLDGIVVFEGPGSFTGLRIGITVANTLSYSLNIPIVGAQGEGWREQAIKKLQTKQNQTQILPFYGAEPNITKPRK